MYWNVQFRLVRFEGERERKREREKREEAMCELMDEAG